MVWKNKLVITDKKDHFKVNCFRLPRRPRHYQRQDDDDANVDEKEGSQVEPRYLENLVHSQVHKALDIQMVMEQIFSNLDFEDLKTCRLVSPSWRRMAFREMLGRDERIKSLYYMGECKKIHSQYLLVFLQNPRVRLRLLGL